MSPVSFDTKERVKQATDIVELVGSYLPLRREGRVYKAICPWHDDTRPSLQVNPERQSFRCWVCSIGGDVFEFMMKREGVEFPQALALLAERAGIDLGPSLGGSGNRKSEKHALYQAMAWAEEQFHRCLFGDPVAEPARAYLRDRGISDESIRRYHIGYSPDQWQWLLEKSSGTPHSPAILEQVGLVASSPNSGRRYDRFKGRVLFSIRDEQGRPIATGGRILPGNTDERAAKYVNSPETPLFSKSNQLYGLDLAKDAISRSKQAVVMEGYTDCVIAAQFGVDNALAVLGTALGERHVRLLSRFADQIVLVLDGDEAGQRRTNDILQLFIAANLDLRVATLPEGLDPCDFLLQRGADAFQQEIAAAVDAFEHKLRTVTRGIDPASGSHDAAAALEEMLQLLAQGPGQAARDTEQQVRINQLLGRLARSFHVSEELLRERVVAERRRIRRPARSAGTAPSDRRQPEAWEAALLEILLCEPEAVARAHESVLPNELADDQCRQIYSRACDLMNNGVLPSFDRLMLEIEDAALKSLLVELDERGQERLAQGIDVVAQLPDVLASLAGRRQRRTETAAVAALKGNRLDEKQEQQQLEQLLRVMQTRHRTSKPMDG